MVSTLPAPAANPSLIEHAQPAMSFVKGFLLSFVGTLGFSLIVASAY